MNATQDREAYEQLLMLWASVRHDTGVDARMSDALYYALREAWIEAGVREVTKAD